MRINLSIFLLACLLTPAAQADTPNLEQRFDALIHPDDLRNWLRTMAAEPNQVGSPHDKANAEFEQKLLKSWGWDAKIETFEVLYPTPAKICRHPPGTPYPR
jgi:N-acetylated-alpha-linked acidic dipeptidase